MDDFRILISKSAEGLSCFSGVPVFVWGETAEHNENAEALVAAVEAVSDLPFVLCAFRVTDWNRQFSPWAAPAVFGKEDFSGGGKVTLDFLLNDVLPVLREKFSGCKFFTAGYSLAGLFSLWALYECNAFDGGVCCSSSLWFDGWDAYAGSRCLKNNGVVYLSLGDREARTKNKKMAQVADRTKMTFDFLNGDSNVRNVQFEWNEGGHFADPSGRLARGMLWVMENK